MNATASSCPPVPVGFRVTRATDEDAGLLCELVRELADYEKLTAECHITEEAVRAHLLGPTRTADALIAWIEHIPVGYAVYYRTFSTFAAKPGIYLEDLYVRPRHRRQGIGRLLLGVVGQVAARTGAGRFEWTALKWNENARRLYASLGAREMEEWVLLRMEGEALSAFACKGGASGGGCRCGGKGAHHAGEKKSCNC